MVHHRALATLLVLPSLALAVPHAHGHAHAHQKRAQQYHTEYTTVQVVKTVWEDEQPTDVASVNNYQPDQADVPTPTPTPDNAPAAVAPSSSPSSAPFVIYSSTSSSAVEAQPSESTGGGSGELTLPAGGAGKVTFQNNCGESVRISKVPPPSCGSIVTKTLDKDEPWTDTLDECSAGNIALKLYRLDADDSQPVHYEYGLNSTQKMAWYNLSFVNCAKHDKDGNPDLSDCVGSQWGIGSCETCQQYKCTKDNPRACCAESGGGYCDPFATAASQQPVGGCGEPNHQVPDLMINMQLC